MSHRQARQGIRAASRRRTTGGGGAAATFTQLTTFSDTTTATSYTTDVIAPTANNLLLLGFMLTITGTTPTPTVTGNGLTWVQVDQSVAGARTVHLFRAMGAAPTSGGITISTGATSVTSCLWSVTQVAGMDTTGTNGSGAIVQSVNNKPGSATSASVSFSNAVAAGNATLGLVGVAIDELPTAGTGWTALGSTTQTGPTSGLLAEAATAARQSIDASWTTAVASFVVGAEIKVP